MQRTKDITDHILQLESDVKSCIYAHTPTKVQMGTATIEDNKVTMRHTSRTSGASSPYKTQKVYLPGRHTVNRDAEGQTNINIYNKRQVEFTYKGDTYIQDKKEFMKSSPMIMAPQNVDDGLTLNSQL